MIVPRYADPQTARVVMFPRSVLETLPIARKMLTLVLGPSAAPRRVYVTNQKCAAVYRATAQRMRLRPVVPSVVPPWGYVMWRRYAPEALPAVLRIALLPLARHAA